MKAALLASSLRFAFGRSLRLVAGVPESLHDWSALSSNTKQLFTRLNVEFVAIRNPFGLDYPIANKIATLMALEDEPCVLLDSDILCTSPAEQAAMFNRSGIAAKPADVLSFDSASVWRELYSTSSLDISRRRVMTTVSRQLCHPYFNSGVIIASKAAALGSIWMTFCLRLRDRVRTHGACKFLDQIALPIAALTLGIDISALSECWNYPLNLKCYPSELTLTPHFVHYHRPQILSRDRILTVLVNRLCHETDGLSDLLERDPAWKSFIGAKARRAVIGYGLRKNASVRDFLITGIPRSGTSLVCRLCDDTNGVVAINEPAGALFRLHSENYGEWISMLHACLRRDVLQGRPVSNKIQEGRVVTNTVDNPERSWYIPNVGKGALMIGTKNTLAYLTRISDLRRAMPDTPICACIRHPVDTIASWKQSFSHLRNAEISEMRKDHLIDTRGSRRSERMVAAMLLEQDVMLRRALLWVYCASQIVEQRDRLFLVRIEDLVDNKAKVCKTLFLHLGIAGSAKSTTESSAIMSRRPKVELDASEKQLIVDVCGPVAEELGYIL